MGSEQVTYIRFKEVPERWKRQSREIARQHAESGSIIAALDPGKYYRKMKPIFGEELEIGVYFIEAEDSYEVVPVGDVLKEVLFAQNMGEHVSVSPNLWGELRKSTNTYGLLSPSIKFRGPAHNTTVTKGKV